MNAKKLTELIPCIIFILSGILTLIKIPHSSYVVFLSGLLLMIIYLFLSVWLFSEETISIFNRITIGIALCLTILGLIFSINNFYGNLVFIVVSYMALGTLILNCLYKIKRKSYKKILVRGLLYLVLLTVVYFVRYPL